MIAGLHSANKAFKLPAPTIQRDLSRLIAACRHIMQYLLMKDFMQLTDRFISNTFFFPEKILALNQNDMLIKNSLSKIEGLSVTAVVFQGNDLVSLNTVS